jgi:hypothetical protein
MISRLGRLPPLQVSSEFTPILGLKGEGRRIKQGGTAEEELSSLIGAKAFLYKGSGDAFRCINNADKSKRA